MSDIVDHIEEILKRNNYAKIRIDMIDNTHKFIVIKNENDLDQLVSDDEEI